MSEFQKRRFIFIDFENLKKVKFKKLEKVCDRVFILIDAKETSIPFNLVQQIQRLGKSVRWIPIHNPNNGDLNYHIAFLMGKFHQKIDKQTEFAILSNDSSFDPLISFINSQARSCIRVRTKKSNAQKKIIQIPKNESKKAGKAAADLEKRYLEAAFKGNIENTATETIRRMKRTGKRPEELSMLRNYIILYNQELTKRGNVDDIIQQMENDKKIAVRGRAVTYLF